MNGSYLGNGFGGRGVPYGGLAVHDILFTQSSSPTIPSRASLFPGDAMLADALHPGSYMFAVFPGDIALESSNGKTKMRTIMTCSGCALTMATCDWSCGPTFSFCNMGNIYGDSFTGLTCPGPTGLICGDGGNTNIACPTGIICGSGGNSLMTCSSGGFFCGVGISNTSRTCDIFGCRSSSAYPCDGNTLMRCASNLSGCGQTALFCPRQPKIVIPEYSKEYWNISMSKSF